MFNLNVQSVPQGVQSVPVGAQSVPQGEEIPCGKTCPASGFQLANVSVPVTVYPFAEAGAPKTKCCGDAIVTPGKDTCNGRPHGACSFTISQRICVEVPVVFGAKAIIGGTTIECECATSKDICKKYEEYYKDDETN
jgi:hypothetical protein